MLVQCRVLACPWKPLLTTSLEEVKYNKFALWSLKGSIGYWWAIKVKRKRKASLKWHHGDNGVRFHTTTTWIEVWMTRILDLCCNCSKIALNASTGTRWLDSRKNQPRKMYSVTKKYDDLKKGCFHSAAIILLIFFFTTDVWVGRNYFAAVSRHNCRLF